MIRINEISAYLESLAPLSSQEAYDNAGLIVGNPSKEVSNVLISLDCLESTVDEAIRLGCELIIAHHPILFKGLKRLNGKSYVERTIIKAIKNDVAIYAIHTNLDNYRYGVNDEIAERLGLINRRVLLPKSEVLSKLVCFVPMDHIEAVRNALFEAGAGEIGNYAQCSFSVEGEGTFLPNVDARPHTGTVNELSKEREYRLEVLCSNHKVNSVIAAMKNAHPYEEVAYELYPILNTNQEEGSGLIGELESGMDESLFLEKVKKTFNCSIVRHTELLGKPIQHVAVCGGSGSFLIQHAKRNKADIYITADVKYHEFFDADGQIVVADIGHFESEQFTSHRLERILTKKFTKFAVHLTEVNTNPIKYF